MNLPRSITLLLIVFFLAACASSSGNRNIFDDALSGLDNWGAPKKSETRSDRNVLGNSSSFTGAMQRGTGSFVSSRAPQVAAGTTTAGQDGYTLNLVNVPIKDAAKKVLGDTLNLNYVVDPQVQGSMTIQTSSPVSHAALIDIFEMTLAVNDAVIVRKNDTYQIVHTSAALRTTPTISVPRVSSSGPGLQVQVIELQHISADEMNNILAPISREGSILRVDNKRNLIMLAGNGPDLRAMREAISVFDVDWMRGMSVALHPLQTSQPVAIANELDAIFGNTGTSAGKTLRFIPNERLNAILVITSRPRNLRRAAVWIEKLDAQAKTNEDQLFVYQIQNRPAPELAEILRSVLSGENTDVAGDSAVAPQLTSGEVTTEGYSDAVQTASGNSGQGNPRRTSIVADVENNALLISTSTRQYERIKKILRQLDILPTQVMLEAVIAEVTLDDELELGVRWFYENGGFELGLSDLASGLVGATFPGFNWTFASSDLKVTLNALASITDVNIVSSPTIMARNNQKAVLQVGDEVPIVTQQAVDTTNPSAVVNSVEMRDLATLQSIGNGLILRCIL